VKTKKKAKKKKPIKKEKSLKNTFAHLRMSHPDFETHANINIRSASNKLVLVHRQP